MLSTWCERCYLLAVVIPLRDSLQGWQPPRKTISSTSLITHIDNNTQNITAEYILKTPDSAVTERKQYKDRINIMSRDRQESKRMKQFEEPTPTPAESHKVEEQRPASSFTYITCLKLHTIAL